jgi:hypothetical protein
MMESSQQIGGDKLVREAGTHHREDLTGEALMLHVERLALGRQVVFEAI